MDLTSAIKPFFQKTSIGITARYRNLASELCTADKMSADDTLGNGTVDHYVEIEKNEIFPKVDKGISEIEVATLTLENRKNLETMFLAKA